MLPGFRFLLAAIVLSMSILIFGLGAAALLRAAHEEVASVPARRVMPEPVFAQQIAAPAPTLALLRVEPSAPQAVAAAPEKASEPVPAAEPAPEAVPVPKVETEKLAALKLDEVPPAEPAKPELAASEPAVPLAATADPAPATETKVAAVAAPPEPAATEAAPPPFELIAPPALMTDTGIAPIKTAALGSPVAKVEKPAETKKSAEKPDRSEIKKQQRAERAKERRRQAARRARLAAQQAAVQQATDPFSQVVQPTPPAATTRRR